MTNRPVPTNSSGIPLHPGNPDYPVLSGEELLFLIHDLAHAIEACGASVELTNAVTKATDLSFHVKRFIEHVAPPPEAPLSIDDAITHARDVAQHHCECGRQHSQLADWLTELKVLRGLPEGHVYMLVERGVWTEQQAEAAAKTMALMKLTPGVDDRHVALAVADAALCAAPKVTLADMVARASVTVKVANWDPTPEQLNMLASAFHQTTPTKSTRN